jgi:hypothetical protein
MHQDMGNLRTEALFALGNCSLAVTLTCHASLIGARAQCLNLLEYPIAFTCRASVPALRLEKEVTPESIPPILYFVKPQWTDDLSEHSRAEILRCDTENRAWNKALRGRATALVNSRLAKEISLEEYTISRQRENENAAECRRRGAILITEMSRRNRPLSDRTQSGRETVVREAFTG